LIAFLPLACMLVAVDGDPLRCGSERIAGVGGNHQLDARGGYTTAVKLKLKG
jgi:hypothetical protein